MLSVVFIGRMVCLLNIDGVGVQKKIIWLLIAIFSISIGLWIFGYLKIDSCLDSGGRWDYELGSCEKY